jgi:hypothetical protein
VPYCHQCTEKMAIQCVWCGRPILVGSLITLMFSDSPNYVYPSYAVPFDRGNGRISYVGCPRTDCADTGLDYRGFWDPPGKVNLITR